MVTGHSATLRHLNGANVSETAVRNFSTNDEMKQVVLGWFSLKDRALYTEAFQALI